MIFDIYLYGCLAVVILTVLDVFVMYFKGKDFTLEHAAFALLFTVLSWVGFITYIGCAAHQLYESLGKDFPVIKGRKKG